jgi:hypothetical protein
VTKLKTYLDHTFRKLVEDQGEDYADGETMILARVAARQQPTLQSCTALIWCTGEKRYPSLGYCLSLWP